MSGGMYEPTMIPAHVFKDGLNIVLTPTEINDILLQICIEDAKEEESRIDDEEDGVPEELSVSIELDGTDDSMKKVIDKIGRELDENPDIQKIVIRGEGCKHHHYGVVAACMAWYAVSRRCPRVHIRDKFEGAEEGPRRIGHSKGYALRKYALTTRPPGFSALMLQGIAQKQVLCANTAPSL